MNPVELAKLLLEEILPPGIAQLVRGQFDAWDMDGQPKHSFTEQVAVEVLQVREWRRR